MYIINTCEINLKASDICWGTCGMFDWSYFDNSKVVMFDYWKVSFLRKFLFLFNLTPNLT